MWRSFSAFPQLFKNHIKKEEGRKPSRILGFQPKTMCYEKSDCERFLKEWAAAGIIEAAKDSFEVFPT